MSRPAADPRPFLLLSTRAEDAAAHAEQLSFARAMRIAPAALHQIRLERGTPGRLDLAGYSGIVVGGGPYNYSDAAKPPRQREVEAWFADLLAEVLGTGFPFFGACYGVGLLGVAGAGVVSRAHGEEAGVVAARLTEAGRADPVLAGLPGVLHAAVGHKEAIEVLPQAATLLAVGEACPVQMFRLGPNAYATQFHPELDADAFAQRLAIYNRHGYFSPGGDARAVAESRRLRVERSGAMLANFARLHARPR